jgi:predicted outer membrane protein
MKHAAVAVGFALTVFIGAGAARAQQGGAMGYGSGSTSPGQVVSNLHLWNLAQIEMGRLAQTNSQNDQVRRLGKDLAKDFTDADRKLIEFCQKNSITLDPPGRNGLGGIQLGQTASRVQQLYGTRGQDFDRQFLNELPNSYSRAASAFNNVKGQVDPNLAKVIDGDMIPKVNHYAQRASGVKSQVFGQQQGSGQGGTGSWPQFQGGQQQWPQGSQQWNDQQYQNQYQNVPQYQQQQNQQVPRFQPSPQDDQPLYRDDTSGSHPGM